MYGPEIFAMATRNSFRFVSFRFESRVSIEGVTLWLERAAYVFSNPPTRQNMPPPHSHDMGGRMMGDEGASETFVFHCHGGRVNGARGARACRSYANDLRGNSVGGMQGVSALTRAADKLAWNGFRFKKGHCKAKQQQDFGSSTQYLPER
jgi:hypothetical protein